MNSPSNTPRRSLRTILFRVTAVLLGVSPFVALEAGLRLMDWQPVADLRVDPFIEFHGTAPLFVSDEAGVKMRIAGDRMPLFRPDSFSKSKGKDEFRVFVLGGSTVQGRPYSIESSFTTWLELSLQSADPQRDWQVVNCGGVSYASYRLVPILEEVLNYQPDLIILYTGHNEFLEDRSYASVKQVPKGLARVASMMASLKSVSLLRQCCGDALVPNPQVAGAKTKPQLQAEVDALLDYRNGLQDYQRDAVWHLGVTRHFKSNLLRMIRMAKQDEVPILLINPVVNLKDCPPFKMADTDGLSPSLATQSATLWSQAKSVDSRDSGGVEQAIDLLNQALVINEEHAGIHYHLAQCYLQSGELESAKLHFQRAKDEDICPLRILSSMRHDIGVAARLTETPVVDVQQMFEEVSEGGIPGERWLIDHVHPTIAGHQKIAHLLVTELIKQELVRPCAGWKSVEMQRYAEHLRSLDLVYFERGKQRREGLDLWTKGRAAKVRP